MFQLGVALTALAILFALTTMALSTNMRLAHPHRVAAALAAALAVGLALLLD